MGSFQLAPGIITPVPSLANNRFREDRLQQSRTRQEAVLAFPSYRSLTVAALLLIQPRPLLGRGTLNTYAARGVKAMVNRDVLYRAEETTRAEDSADTSIS